MDIKSYSIQFLCYSNVTFLIRGMYYIPIPNFYNQDNVASE